MQPPHKGQDEAKDHTILRTAFQYLAINDTRVIYLIKALIELRVLPVREGVQTMLCSHSQQGAVEYQVLVRALCLALACSTLSHPSGI